MKFVLSTLGILARSAVLTVLFPVLAFAGFSTDIGEGAQLPNPQQQIVFSADHLGAASTLNTYTRVLLVNGVDRTDLTTVDVNWTGTFTVTFTPTEDNPLPQGDVFIDLTIRHSFWLFWMFWDTEEHLQLNVFVDSEIPEITLVTPLAGETISDLQTPLTFSVVDNGVGVDSATIVVLINDEDKTSQASFANGELVYTPDGINPLPEEPFQAKVSVSDSLGNHSESTFDFLVETRVVLSATPVAIPQTTYAPATIRFTPEITTGNAIQTYKWDFNGDGIFDSTDIIGNSYTYNYNTPGDYVVTLEVLDALGEVTAGTVVVHILNEAPEISVEATPSNGAVPLVVNFTVVATDNEGVNLYEWDFDGDGIYDYTSSTTGNTSFTYTDSGQYSATFRATDGLGEVTVYTLPTTTVIAGGPDSPSVTAITNIASGTVSLTVTLSATASDPLSQLFTLWEWDFDGDGTYDYSNTQTGTVAHTFDVAGIYYPIVKVTTEDGRFSIDAVEVIVENSINLTRDVDTVDVAVSEQATITTTLGGTTRISLVIEDRSMQVVRTLVDWTERVGGSYQDPWDGLRDDQTLVAEGDYYAVLLYEEGDLVKRFDLRETTGGIRYNPARNNADRYFSPFDNDPMQITFTLTGASEVTAFMGYSNSNTRIATFMSRQPLGKGSHTVLWYGTNNEGALITPPVGKWFMFGVWAYRLADNAIYVKSGAHLHSVSAVPPIFDPTSHEEDGLRAKSRITFTLTADASVELQVADGQSGTLAATRTYSGLFAGENTIEWDGKNGAGEFLSPGKYRLGIRAIDASGYRSLMEYTLQRIYY